MRDTEDKRKRKKASREKACTKAEGDRTRRRVGRKYARRKSREWKNKAQEDAGGQKMSEEKRKKDKPGVVSSGKEENCACKIKEITKNRGNKPNDKLVYCPFYAQALKREPYFVKAYSPSAKFP